MKHLMQHLLMKIVDTGYAVIPRPRPALARLQAARVVSHRGDFDNHRVFENTLAAFQAALDAGVWGVEADLRWSRDGVPLIVHDPDGRRLFGDHGVFVDMAFAEIRRRMPLVPTLDELLHALHGRAHLMLEIKDEHYRDATAQCDRLHMALQGWRAGEDYHLLALDSNLFERAPFVDKRFCFPVAELNSQSQSRAALAGGYGGLTGHFVLLTQSLQRRHESAGQRIGTGFVSSRYCLYRELNRGVDWIFSNDAVKLQGVVDAMIAAAQLSDRAEKKP